MHRKEFLKKSLLGGALLTSAAAIAHAIDNDIDELRPLDIVGHNHLPNISDQVMNNTILHKADIRTDKFYFSFSLTNR